MASTLVRSTSLANPLVVNGDPRSEVNTNGDLGSCSRCSFLKARISSPGMGGRVALLDPSLCHLFATVENGIVASKSQEFRPQPPTIRLVTGYVSMRCRMLRVDEDTFTMISGLIAIAVVCIAGLLALG